MLTLLLAAAACAADPTVKCEDLGNSTTYNVTNGISAALGFTPAGDGVVAVCVRGPGSATSGYVHLLDAFSGDRRQVTTAACASSDFGEHTLMTNGPSVVSLVSSKSVPAGQSNALVFIPLNGSAPFTQKTAHSYTAASNGESLTAVAVSGFDANSKFGYFLQVRDNHGALQQSIRLKSTPTLVAVSKRGRNSSYYTAVLVFGVPSVVTVYESNGETVADHTLPDFTFAKGMKFRDEDNRLVVAGAHETIVYNIKAGAEATFYQQPRGSNSVAFNADGSKMAVYLNTAPSVVYIRNLYTGAAQSLCTVDGDTGVSLATDGQGRSVVLAYSQVNSSAPLSVTIFNVPDVTTAPATAAPTRIVSTDDGSPPIGVIVGGIAVALLVAACVGFWLWKKRQAVPEDTYVDMASVEPTVN